MTDPVAPVIPTPVVNPTQPTRKVTWASLGAYLAGLAGLAIIQGVSGHLDVITASWPAWVNILVAPLIPAAIAFVTGYLTKHAPNDVLLRPFGARRRARQV